jgi:transcriptional regulator with XRE-family HTH domain
VKNLIKIAAERLKAARESRGLTQAELGEELGLSADAISKIEHGRAALNLRHLEKLPKILNYPIGYFLDLNDELSPSESEIIQLLRLLSPDVEQYALTALRAWAKPAPPNDPPEPAQPEAEPEPPEISDEKRAEYEQVIEDIDLYLAIDRATPEIREWALNFLIELRDRIQAQKAKEHGDALLYPTN